MGGSLICFCHLINLLSAIYKTHTLKDMRHFLIAIEIEILIQIIDEMT